MKHDDRDRPAPVAENAEGALVATVGPAPPAAGELFGDRLPLAERFARSLAGSGVSRGLIGPREIGRLWERHLLNCAALGPALDPHSSVIDVGSGAGLPGLALAIARPDLEVVLVEPMLRRSTWLSEVVTELGLTNVSVRRARAEELWGELHAPWVTARAVARLAQLCRWCLPLLEPHGSLLALKGSTAGDELADDRAEISRWDAASARVEEYGGHVLAVPTTVVRVQIGAVTPDGRHPGPKPGSRRGRRGRRAGGSTSRQGRRP